jgi:hypothetical protein
VSVQEIFPPQSTMLFVRKSLVPQLVPQTTGRGTVINRHSLRSQDPAFASLAVIADLLIEHVAQGKFLVAL